MASTGGGKILASNRKAGYSYELSAPLECGIVLRGSEIKSLRKNGASLLDAYVTFKDGEAWLMDMTIAPYEHGNLFNHEPDRPRKLLLHKKEIFRYAQRVKEESLTIVPLKVYLRNGRAKAEIALARGKKRFDKRETIRRREDERTMDRAKKARGQSDED